jgi:transcriptional regulator with GAF, ATPase, and Fis domain
MNIREMEFFHQATLRICSELDVHKALENTIDYLRQFIPAEELFFAIYYPESSTAKVVALASKTKERKFSDVLHIPAKFRRELENKWKTFKGVEISNYNEERPLEDWIEKQFGYPDMSRMHMTLDLTGTRLGIVGVSGQRTIYTAKHSKLFDLLHQPFAIALSNALRYEEVLYLKDILSDDNRFLQDQLRNLSGDEIIGADFGLRPVMELMKQVAPLSSPVLILGESGVGKEVIANGIQALSDRKNAPFIKVNCGAIPESLIDSELFGHEKGAFTGALERKRGRFERAHTGTIFLDEIAELSLQAQVRLLRVLQNREIERVGGTRRIPVDVRILIATNRDLQKMVDQGSFREDLWFRINVFPIWIPPLRTRSADIPALVQHFVEKKSKEFKIHPVPKLSSGVFDWMLGYSWPGNVRELENAVERALIRNKSHTLEKEDFFFPEQSIRQPRSEDVARDRYLPLDRLIRNHIRQVLQHTDGKIHGKNGAAEILEVNPNTLRSRMRKLGIPFGK